MVEHDKVTVLEVKPVELVASRLGIHYVFIDNEGSALCVVGDSLADLTYRAELAKEIEELFGCDVEAQVLYKESSIDLWSKLADSTHNLARRREGAM